MCSDALAHPAVAIVQLLTDTWLPWLPWAYFALHGVRYVMDEIHRWTVTPKDLHEADLLGWSASPGDGARHEARDDA